jgi:predicted phosphohydrolase
MRIFAIGDIHLPGLADKPMDIFGKQWINHVDVLIENWVKIIAEDDIILIPGDISWAMRMDKAQIDLNRLEELPGKKICIRGNHDYWWDRPGKLNAKYKKLYFLQNTSYGLGDLAICGSRGWTSPNSLNFSEDDEKIFKRELIRMKLSLDDAVKNDAKEIIVMLHYPPAFNSDRRTPFISLFEKYPVTHVVYGHLHDAVSWQDAIQGDYQGIWYHLVSADYLRFSPRLIKEYPCLNNELYKKL